jgi:hypothetical protein
LRKPNLLSAHADILGFVFGLLSESNTNRIGPNPSEYESVDGYESDWDTRY